MATTQDPNNPANAPAPVGGGSASPSAVPSAPAPVTASNTLSLAADSQQSATPAEPPPSSVQTSHPTVDASTTAPAPIKGVDMPQPKAVANIPKTPPAPVSGVDAATSAPQSVTLDKKTNKPVAPPPSLLDQQADALSDVNDTIKQMIEGNDPIAQREFNNLITQTGPKNQLALEAMALKLRQENQDGPGAGDALIASMARDMGYEKDQLTANIDTESAKRLYDLNQWGFTQAQNIQAVKTKQLNDNLQTAIKNEQWGTASEIFSQIFPGGTLDVNAAKSADPVAQAAFNAGMGHVQDLINEGDSAGAKNALLNTVAANYAMLGYKSPEEAKAAYANVNYDKEAWNNLSTFNQKVLGDARNAILQNDPATAHSAIDRYYENAVPGAAQTEGRAALSSMPLADINAVLRANDKAPVDAGGAQLLDPVQFAKDKKFADMKTQANGADYPDLILNQFVKANPSLGTNPAERDAAYKWIVDNVTNMQVSPDGTSVTGYTFKSGSTLPPWDPNSTTSYLYMDWPQATFNADGSVQNVTYQGDTPYSDSYKPGDLTTPSGRYNSGVDKNYLNYLMNTRSSMDTRLSRQDWFYATKGGQQVNPIASLAPADPKPIDPAAVTAKLNNGQVLTKEEMTSAIGDGDVQSYDSTRAADAIHSGDMQSLVGKSVAINGKQLIVEKSGSYYSGNQNFNGNSLHDRSVIFKDPSDGQLYTLAQDGRWFKGDPFKGSGVSPEADSAAAAASLIPDPTSTPTKATV